MSVRPFANSNRCRAPEEWRVVTIASVPAVYFVVTDTLGGSGGGSGARGAGAIAAGAGFGFGFGFGFDVCAITGCARARTSDAATASRDECVMLWVPARATDRAFGIT